MTRKMKDSGVEWIGEIPEEWEVAKIKYYCDSIYSGGTPSRLEPKYWNGDINWIPSGYCKNKEIIEAKEKITKEALLNSSTKLINKDTPLVAMTGATCGFTGYLKIDACINQSIMAYIPNKLTNPRFLWYLTLNLYEKYLSLQSGGAQAGINSIDAKNICVPYVKIKEQNNIAKILDIKTEQIENIKSTITKEIQTLEDYRKSMITEAVTKGLDKNVEMKDSGIEWIGEIPKHWSKIKLRYLSNIVRGGSPRPINEYMSNSDKDLNWIKIGDTQKGSKYINKTKNKLKTTGLSSTTFVKKGELILSNSMSYGEAYILNIDGCIHDGWLAFKDIKNIDKEYLYFSLLSFNTKIQFDKLSDGGVVQNLNIDKVKTVYVFLSDKKEQVEIANYLNKTIKSIDKAIEGKQKQLESLEEYKKSLIYEYVTGKKEVEDGEES